MIRRCLGSVRAAAIGIAAACLATGAIAAERLPFGLDKLHWGMSPAQVKVILPDMTDPPNNDPEVVFTLPALTRKGYRWGHCTVTLGAIFDHDKLSILSLAEWPDTKDVNCETAVLKDLTASLGEAGIIAHRGGTVSRDWCTPETTFRYWDPTRYGMGVVMKRADAPWPDSFDEHPQLTYCLAH